MFVILTTHKHKQGESKMQYIILEIKGYMNFMSLEAAARKVERNGGNFFLIAQAVKEIKKEIEK